ncbi:PREDICTED: GRIP1-associated protein 1 [Eufriesea mexicana]|uniref:GRIP1-associated protein 1 n=1 Tax=Eufriesea mexicana TaxID=516756 RepID=UPI00083BCB8D|nr:PREDICTED: GRIP1-associated protein 1 [Eufriesea mexicana]
MGCNTSKESVQPVGDEAKEDGKNGDILKVSESSSPTKAEEASQKKTQESKESKKESESKSLNEGKEEKRTEGKGVEKQREEAATRIQAAFRGHHARKSMKETESSTKQTGTKSNSEPTKEELQQEFRADDKELCEAATKIQASFRGHMSRKEQAAAAIVKSAENAVENVVCKMEEKYSVLRPQNSELRSLYLESTIQYSDLGFRVQNSELKSQYLKPTTRISDLSTEGSELRTQISVLRIHNSGLASQYSVLRFQISELRSQYLKPTTEVFDLSTQGSDLRSENTELRSQCLESTIQDSDLST